MPDESVLFVGNFEHAPNRDAAFWLASEIMPAVWAEHPSARLWIVGRGPTADVRALDGPRVVVTGEVPSVVDYLRSATVFVAPLREGGGMRVKVLEAMAAGLPVVTTPIGAEGLGARSGEHLLVAEGASEIAEQVSAVLGDPSLRARLGSEARRLASDASSKARRVQALEALIARVAPPGETSREAGAVVGGPELVSASPGPAAVSPNAIGDDEAGPPP